MDINHPWTKYEIARLRDEERLLRARSAMRVVEAREARGANEPEPESTQETSSLLERIRRRGIAPGRAPAKSRA